MTINEYIETFPKEKQKIMMELYSYITQQFPMLKEKISWQMPTFYTKHNIIHFAMNKHHLGIYPGSDAMEVFATEVQNYQPSKGAFHILLIQDIPFDLIHRIISYNLKKED